VPAARHQADQAHTRRNLDPANRLPRESVGGEQLHLTVGIGQVEAADVHPHRRTDGLHDQVHLLDGLAGECHPLDDQCEFVNRILHSETGTGVELPQTSRTS